MAQIGFPLDNVEYYAKDVRLFHAGRTGGVVNYTGDDFKIVDVSGMMVRIGVGCAYLKAGTDSVGGIVYENDETIGVTFSSASNLDRYDYIAIRYDAVKNSVELISVKGSSSMPDNPIRNDSVWELVLYAVKVNANSARIEEKDIYDLRMKEKFCGLAVDTMAKIPTDQYDRRFNDFMNKVEKTYDKDALANLTNRVLELEERVENTALDLMPVGYIYISLDETNPHDLFGGVWERFAGGMALVGAGTHEDKNGEEQTFEAGEEFGLYNHQHHYGIWQGEFYGITSVTGLMDADIYGEQSWLKPEYVTAKAEMLVNTGLSTSRQLRLVSSQTAYAKTTPEIQIQPSMPVYMWRRVA